MRFRDEEAQVLLSVRVQSNGTKRQLRAQEGDALRLSKNSASFEVHETAESSIVRAIGHNCGTRFQVEN